MGVKEEGKKNNFLFFQEEKRRGQARIEEGEGERRGRISRILTGRAGKQKAAEQSVTGNWVLQGTTKHLGTRWRGEHNGVNGRNPRKGTGGGFETMGGKSPEKMGGGEG